MLGERGLWYKMNFFEHSARVPLIMAGPSVAQGTAANACSLIDLLPTFIDAAGGNQSMLGEPIDGRSLMPLARGETDLIDEAIGDVANDDAGHMARLQDMTEEASDLIQLLRMEDTDSSAMDAITALLQVKRTIHAAIAA